ncbi:hypothetical protein GCM10025877_25760 [Agromyces mangrovi Wang et al. 2018]|nr:hypothetical protein GCM10025877_25760 [Agromyces mangrovi]
MAGAGRERGGQGHHEDAHQGDEHPHEQHLAEQRELRGRAGEPGDRVDVARRPAAVALTATGCGLGAARRAFLVAVHRLLHRQPAMRVAARQPLRPWVATPSTRKRWKTTKNTRIGIRATNDAVTVAP